MPRLPVTSARCPVSGGITAPPTIATQMTPDPSAARSAESFAGQTEDGREHDRVREPDGEQRVARKRCRVLLDEQRIRTIATIATEREQLAGADDPQKRRADEPADQSPAPIDRNQLAGGLLADAEHVRLHEVVDDQRADRDFRTDVQEDGQRAETEARALRSRSKPAKMPPSECRSLFSRLRNSQTANATTASAMARPR